MLAQEPLFAHSENGEGKWHLLGDHLLSVGNLAAEFARPFGAEDWARLAGYWHDLGKASSAFQVYLRNASHLGEQDEQPATLKAKIDHTSAGAQYAVREIQVLGGILAFVISGHHAGLLDAISDGTCLEHRLRKAVEPWHQGLDLVPSVENPEPPKPLRAALTKRTDEPDRAAFSVAFFTRMLFSCLVDADFLDTEAFLDSDRASCRPRWPSDILKRMQRALDIHVAGLEKGKSLVATKRRLVREACRQAAPMDPGFFSLTVPTGGGKTLSSLAFAIDHALHHGLTHVVYVIPFTSIIEQNAAVFRTAFNGALGSAIPDPVLEHHSSLIQDSQSTAGRLAAENWDAPLVVTTSVQFYESLFSNRASRCRKLHNLANAVIVLDEVQKLPIDLLRPCLLALEELSSQYGCSVVLCTATQPALEQRPDFPIGLRGIREIVSDPPSLYEALRRVDVTDLGFLADGELAKLVKGHHQALCIVNTRRHARELFLLLEGQADVIHLSAAMCPAHRSDVLRMVAERLSAGLPCRVISTQLVEAGVDLDFPIVYRSLAGLDSIAQAAGRCNRNGTLKRGKTYIFRSEHGTEEAFLRDTVNAAAQIIGGASQPALFEDLLSLDAVEKYFQLYYWDQEDRWDARGIVDEFKLQNRQELPFLFGFRTVAEKFRLIENGGQAVIVPWGHEGRALCGELSRPFAYPPVELVRSLQRYSVQIPSRSWHRAQGRIFEIVGGNFAVVTCPEIYYDARVGLILDDPDLAPDSCIV